MVEGTTNSGFEFVIDGDALTDAEFLEDFVELRDGTDSLRLFRIIERMLGKDQKKKLYDHVRNDAGKVTVTALAAEFSDLIVALANNAQTKN